MTPQSSRRRFLKTGCFTAAAVGLTVCGGGALVASYQPTVDLPSTTLGGAAAAQRLLIAYASKAGSTAEAALRMGTAISGPNLAVDVKPVASVTDLAPYSAVILGSAIRTGSLLPEAMTFLQANQAALAQKPLSVFVLCMTLEKDTAENRNKVSFYLDPVRAIVKPVSEGLFAGKMDLDKLPLFERLIILMMNVPSGDFRQWDQINAWAKVK